jgi:hypothetical protein
MANRVSQIRGVAKLNKACALLREADYVNILQKDLLPPLIQRLRRFLDQTGDSGTLDRNVQLGTLAANIRMLADRLRNSAPTAAEKRIVMLLDQAADICSDESWQ